MASTGVGQRIAAYRRRRGLSQAALAGLVGRSESWLSQVERGVKSVDRLSVLLDLARILHVDVESLVGRPWQFAPNGGGIPEGLDSVRRVMTRYDDLLGLEAPSIPALADVESQVERLHRDYQAARYEEALTELPAVLATVDAIPRLVGDERRDALPAYVAAYVGAAKLLTKLGGSDLAVVAADRAAGVAAQTDSPVVRGMAGYQVVAALMRADRTEEAERISIGLAEELYRSATPEAPSVASVSGALWLMSAVLAGRRTDSGEAWQRLEVAGRLAEMVGADANYAWTAFGPTNVGIHRVSVATELGDAGEAVRVASDVNTDNLSEGLRSRRAQVHLDLAWAQAQRHKDAEVLLHLLEAERGAPETIRYNIEVREILREVMARSRRKNTILHDLAVRAGALD